MNREEVLRDALTAVNGIRQGWGLEPLSELPKGVPEHYGNCPIARALSNGHTVTVASYITVYHQGQGQQVFQMTLPTPPSISRFLSKFDAELYPELIA